ncbi:glutamate ABC transporter substrate-binding protein [Stackebrandtia soli]|uniref:glutamate ABC transporter substrate-binding protein n=1 Tax=Stackebrandtia soli TaxID=1892856 RepID=UPI0039E81D7F
MKTSLRSRLSIAGLVVSLLAVSGCGAGEVPVSADPVMVDDRPAGVEDPAELPDTVTDDTSCEPRASFRPSTNTDASELKRIIERGRLIVGVDQNSYMLGYRDPLTGEMAGFDIAIAREIARDLLGDPDAIQFKAISSAQRVPVLADEKVDLVVRSMSMTCARWEEVSFSTEYYTAGQKVLVAATSTAESIDDLSGQKICAAAGSTSLRRIHDHGAVPVSVRDWTDCLILLQQGEVAAVSTDDVILAGMAAQDPNTKVIGEALSEEPYGVAANKSHSGLVRFVNATLDRIRSDGTWDDLYDESLRDTLGDGSAPSPKYQDD